MDEVDEKILELLRMNSRASYGSIGKAVGLSEGAVRARVKKLVESGVIRRFTVETGTLREAEALSMISVNPSVPTSKVSAALRSLSKVRMIYEVTGEYDIVVAISAADIAEVNECVEQIRKIEGVLDTNTMVVLRKW
ncbi:MAG: Lrp/AsnC family transcriptional regulator [Candidatus Bathyarchaeota archaeon]|nr:Lrp/AsnC family transcriptional regulator [Candidatus Bathyarchaeota archaeon]MCX8176702.1 Lrp/AsnC family transcriptional regulator [Candidatus Bathyarchaeota archaeon]MDW8193230.1 Lrp/AsnC family transcriptional regulator [Nitrososphaerota archaeon]